MSTAYDAFSESFALSRERIWPDLRELMSLPDFVDVTAQIVGDMGCGSGRLLEYFLQKPKPTHYIGLDVSEGMLFQARKRYPEYVFECQDMRTLYSWKQVDVLFYIASFHHLLTLSEQIEALVMAKKMLKENGKLVFLNWNLTAAHLLDRYPASITEPIRYIPYNGNDRHYRAWWLAEFTQFLSTQGCQVVFSWVTKSLANMIHIATPT